MWVVGPVTERNYLAQIRAFLTMPEHFENFKRHYLYATVIGQPTIQQAYGFYMKLREDKELMAKLPEFGKMDKIGGPFSYPFDNIFYTLNLIRYANSVQLISKHLGSLDGLQVCEVGQGFGGLAYCCHQMWKPAAWNIIDLEESMDLAVKHNEMLGVKLIKGQPESYDLAIAEFSLTEQRGQELFDLTEKYLFPATKIWVRCNIMEEEPRAKWFEFVGKKFNLNIQNEDPVGVYFNKIVVGNRKDA